MEDEKYYNCIVLDENNKEYKINSKQFYNLNLHNFFNWQCNAGVDSIYIENDLVYGGECQNDLLGTIQNWELLKKPTTCSRQFCSGCTIDLMIVKKKYIDK
jgi:hypothetical protein